MARESAIRLAWIASAAMAVAGVVTYVVSGADWAWYVGLTLASPFLCFVVWRSSARGDGNGGGGGDGGAWGPP